MKTEVYFNIVFSFNPNACLTAMIDNVFRLDNRKTASMNVEHHQSRIRKYINSLLKSKVADIIADTLNKMIGSDNSKVICNITYPYDNMYPSNPTNTLFQSASISVLEIKGWYNINQLNESQIIYIQNVICKVLRDTINNNKNANFFDVDISFYQNSRSDSWKGQLTEYYENKQNEEEEKANPTGQDKLQIKITASTVMSKMVCATTRGKLYNSPFAYVELTDMVDDIRAAIDNIMQYSGIIMKETDFMLFDFVKGIDDVENGTVSSDDTQQILGFEFISINNISSTLLKESGELERIEKDLSRFTEKYDNSEIIDHFSVSIEIQKGESKKDS